MQSTEYSFTLAFRLCNGILRRLMKLVNVWSLRGITKELYNAQLRVKAHKELK